MTTLVGFLIKTTDQNKNVGENVNNQIHGLSHRTAKNFQMFGAKSIGQKLC